MMKIDAETRLAVEKCMDANIPFALYALPGAEEACFFACKPDSGDDGRNEWIHTDESWSGFFINFFGNDEAYTPGIRREMDATQAIKYADSLKYPDRDAEIDLQTESTHPLKYRALVASIVSRLKKRGGKVVISRLQVMSSTDTVLNVALRYFDGLAQTFRYLCFTQETGVWLGATPELIGRFDRKGGQFETMALAGTMPVDCHDWDKKNIEEHMIVVFYIYHVLKTLGAEIEPQSPGELIYGDIKHLVTPIKTKLKAIDPQELLYMLSPTPAVAGYPRDIAIKDIFTGEPHSRHCYAGFVGIVDNGHVEAYANLRCAMAKDRFNGGSDYNIFVGGGITENSDPATEWQETVDKAQQLVDAIRNGSNLSQDHEKEQ